MSVYLDFHFPELFCNAYRVKFDVACHIWFIITFCPGKQRHLKQEDMDVTQLDKSNTNI